MDSTGIMLVMGSALLHCTWNLLSKTCSSPLGFLFLALKYSMLAYLPLFVLMQFYVSYPPVYLTCMLASGVLCGGYFFALGKAYEHGHLSIAYPLARAVPILLVTFGGMALAGERPSLCATAGIVLILAGCLMLPLRRFGFGRDGFNLAGYVNKSTLWALLSAVFTAGYSLCDKFGAANAPGEGLSGLAGKLNYVYVQNAICFGLVWLTLRFGQAPARTVYRGRAFFCGLLFLFSYFLIMLALVNNPVSYVVSFRQLSIVIGAVVSMLFIEKEMIRVRMLAVLMVFSGVVMVGLG